MSDPTSKTTRDPVLAALGATTEETPESVQYVLIRGLSAMGYAQPVLESHALMQAALKAAGVQNV